MKFMMNGAVTLGTMDGANIEIFESVGAENIFTFGLSAEEVAHYYASGSYHSLDVYKNDARLQRIMNQLIDSTLGKFSNFQAIYDSLLLHNDHYFVLKDFDDYANSHQQVLSAYQNPQTWFGMSLNNVARCGLFSSDRAICDYQRDIWETL
ncbi:MAG: glycogen phosphorylase [Eubacteriaceae bacterium]|jgi:starch phosphorylase|nr:glycogen phosphorylase [Eubacteriaceae bacterium]MDK2961772.1 glycogen phosphorylase [Eubacteriaceae bacterium]